MSAATGPPWRCSGVQGPRAKAVGRSPPGSATNSASAASMFRSVVTGVLGIVEERRRRRALRGSYRPREAWPAALTPYGLRRAGSCSRSRAVTGTTAATVAVVRSIDRLPAVAGKASRRCSGWPFFRADWSLPCPAPSPISACPPILSRSSSVTGSPLPSRSRRRRCPTRSPGRDVSGRAPTGSGKTLAFAHRGRGGARPRAPRSKARRPRGLVLVPTRELAAQVCGVLAPLAKARSLTRRRRLRRHRLRSPASSAS